LTRYFFLFAMMMKLFFAVATVLLLGAAWFGPNAHVESSPTKEASKQVPVDAFSLYQKELAVTHTGTHSSKPQAAPVTHPTSQPGKNIMGQSLFTASGSCNLTTIIGWRVYIMAAMAKTQQASALADMYTEDAVMTMYKNQTNEETSFHGREEIVKFFQRHYLSYFTGTTSAMTHLSFDEKSKVVFMTAMAQELGMDTIADTFIIDHEKCLIRAQTTMMINSDETEAFGAPLKEWGPLSNVFRGPAIGR
jgi:hypothetical protein